MARYIDADKLLEKTEEIEWFNESTGYYDLINIVHKYDVETAPTADVAPKSEVAREIFDEAIRTVYSKTDMKIYNTIDGKPLGDGVAYGKQIAMYDVITLLAELKKKYTEDEK